MAEKPTLRDSLQLQLRGMREIDRIRPGLLPTIAAIALVKALTPYVTIFFSARLLEELAGNRNADALRRWAVLAVAVGGVLALATAALTRLNDWMLDSYRERREQTYVRKNFSLDFADADSQRVYDLRAQITQNNNWAGLGFNQVLLITEKTLRNLLGAVAAVTLTVSLFTGTVPPSAGRLTVLNHPGFAIVLLAVLLGLTAFGGTCGSRSKALWTRAADDAKLGNRVFSAFGFCAQEVKRAADLRVYDQQPLLEEKGKKGRVFGVDGPMARLGRGPIGRLSGAGAASTAVLTGVVYVFACLKAWAGAFGVGMVTQYVGAVTALSQNLAELIEATGRLKSNAPFLETTFSFLDIPNAMYQGSLTTEKRADRQYEVEFRDVSFRYPGTDQWALRHVSRKFAVGSRLAVVGENGSGKTTFIKLLCRLYDPQEGEILLNGIDIRKYDYRDYMAIFSVVFQDFQLLSQPLGANVAGSVAYDRPRADRALRDAGFGDRLDSLPQGLDTQLYRDFGEEGVELSGGEAQKVAIARALYKDAPFLILDEPTAALDPMAEAEIYEHLGTITGDRTAIYISHRLSSCRFCDEILVFDHGQIVQQGSHDDLLADTVGPYAALWHAQAQYYTQQS
jgi:ATP-binding cassette subfamily B protein